jgi:hypothetical protein
LGGSCPPPRPKRTRLACVTAAQTPTPTPKPAATLAQQLLDPRAPGRARPDAWPSTPPAPPPPPCRRPAPAGFCPRRRSACCGLLPPPPLPAPPPPSAGAGTPPVRGRRRAGSAAAPRRPWLAAPWGRRLSGQPCSILSCHSACSRLIRNISKIQSQLKNDMSRTKRFRQSAVNPGHSQQESKAGPRPRFLISRFAWIQARRVGQTRRGKASQARWFSANADHACDRRHPAHRS